jgi:hypothetical protein
VSSIDPTIFEPSYVVRAADGSYDVGVNMKVVMNADGTLRVETTQTAGSMIGNVIMSGAVAGATGADMMFNSIDLSSPSDAVAITNLGDTMDFGPNENNDEDILGAARSILKEKRKEAEEKRIGETLRVRRANVIGDPPQGEFVGSGELRVPEGAKAEMLRRYLEGLTEDQLDAVMHFMKMIGMDEGGDE